MEYEELAYVFCANYTMVHETFTDLNVTLNLNLSQKRYWSYKHTNKEIWEVLLNAEHVQHGLHSALQPLSRRTLTSIMTFRYKFSEIFLCSLYLYKTILTYLRE